MSTLQDIRLNEDMFVFETVMRVRNTETHGSFLSIENLHMMLAEARARFFYSKNIQDKDNNAQGLTIIDTAIHFPAQINAREEILFEVGVDGLSNTQGNLIFKVTRMHDASFVAKAIARFTGYDYHNQKMTHIPQYIVDTLSYQPFEL